MSYSVRVSSQALGTAYMSCNWIFRPIIERWNKNDWWNNNEDYRSVARADYFVAAKAMEIWSGHEKEGSGIFAVTDSWPSDTHQIRFALLENSISWKLDKFYRLSRFLVEKSSFLFCPRIYLPFNFPPYLTLLGNDQWLNLIICLHFYKHPFYAYQWNSLHEKGCDYTRNIRRWKIWTFGSWISRNYQNENLQVSAVSIWKINFNVSPALQVGSCRVERHIDITLYVCILCY